ncbi:hypothetical protein JOD55_000312 [Arcanobacterium pluranimalium]|uniref:DUF4862 family protein n=1 Tax=Arcanobacterium pluranimalium TaxID=108028 RepID=UPI00195EBEE2|nr:DUF4862 family protein [Arcanobacterium pluranimalium]MBM7824485.1 hypothetical protein [Arcanobacterium pluranimalium]
MNVPFIIGAYASKPQERAAQEDFYRLLNDAPWVSGLEIPYMATGLQDDPQWFAQQLGSSFTTNVLTPIPGTMSFVNDSSWGISSMDDAGRAAALSFLKNATDAMKDINDRLGRQFFTHLALHTAPRGRGDVHSLIRSLEELLEWDIDSAKLTIEHCDSFSTDRVISKGFLELCDEIAAARKFDGKVGVSINWGRSAIEGQGADLPLEHVDMAGRAGVLEGVIFSGAHNSENAWGPAWEDAHVGLQEFVPQSLLTPQIVAETAHKAMASNVAYLGAKITILPGPSNEERLHMLGRISTSI